MWRRRKCPGMTGMTGTRVGWPGWVDQSVLTVGVALSDIYFRRACRRMMCTLPSPTYVLQTLLNVYEEHVRCRMLLGCCIVNVGDEGGR